MALETAKNLTSEELAVAFRQLGSQLSETETRLRISESLYKKETTRNTVRSVEDSRLKDQLQEKDALVDWFLRMFFGLAQSVEV